MKTHTLERAIRDRGFVRLTLHVDDDAHIHGAPLALSSTFVLIREVSDMRLDGYYVVPTWNIKAVRARRFERAMKGIARREGWLGKLPVPRGVRLDSAPVLLRVLQRRGGFIIIETRGLALKSSPGEAVMLIGPIVKVSDDAVWIHNFDATGRWERRPVRVAFKDLTTVQFASNYIKVWTRNLPSRPVLRIERPAGRDRALGGKDRITGRRS